MKINLLSKNMELTEAIYEYVEKRVTNLEKLLGKIEENGGEVSVVFEVSQSSKRHKSGDIFHADCLVKIKGEEYYASADEADLYAAVDKIKDTLFREISKDKDRTQTLLHRGARSVKKMLKGLSRRNPFTSKY